MVAATKRTFYSLEHKVRVLDDVAKELSEKPEGAITRVATRHGHEAGLIYNWRLSEKEIRKAAKKELAQAAKERPTLPSSRRLPPPPRVPEMGVDSGVRVRSEQVEPEGPEVTIRALGPWLRGVVKEELPAALDRVLDGKTETFIESIIEKKLDAALERALGRAFSRKGDSDGI